MLSACSPHYTNTFPVSTSLPASCSACARACYGRPRAQSWCHTRWSTKRDASLPCFGQSSTLDHALGVWYVTFEYPLSSTCASAHFHGRECYHLLTAECGLDCACQQHQREDQCQRARQHVHRFCRSDILGLCYWTFRL